MSVEASGEHVTMRPRRRASLSIKSLLLLMLLAVSIGSNVVVGVIGYLNGTESLKEAAVDRLVEVRDARAREISSLFDSVENSLLLASRDSAVIGAEQAFAAGMAELDDAAIAADAVEAAGGEDTAALTLSAEQDAALMAYFTGGFGPELEEATGEPVDAASFLPDSPAARYLLYYYTFADGSGAEPSSLLDAGDGSAWSAAHGQFHDYLRRMASLLAFDDLVLIDDSGQVVYTVVKGVDLGADLVEGPYSFTSLATAFDTAMSANQGLDTVVFSDFKEYSASLGAPVAWVVAPLAGDNKAVGAIAVQLPVDRINEVMTGNGHWEESGLGETGEAYLAGGPGIPTMRSLSRDLAESPDTYAQLAVSAGLPQETADQAVSSGETLLLQRVDTEAVRAGLAGKTGTITSGNYLGTQTIAAFAPFRSHDLQWAIVAEIDAAEALAPVDEFTKRLALSSAIIVGIVSIISVIIAGLAVRPLRRLRDAARRIAAGESGVQVEAGESDELADVAAAFNDMSRSLELKATLIDEQRAENERLLRTLMPEALAKRYKEGARTIVEDHQEVTVLFADIVGFEEYGRGMTSEKGLDILNDIFRAFDEAADTLGVERVRTTRQGYLASSGLSIPRVDHARRAVEFAIEMQRIVERFGAQQGADLSVRAGIDSGTVTSGLVGRSHVVYDLWGDAVSLAFRLQGGANEAGLFLTQRVVDKLADNLPITDSGVVETSSGFQRVWRIDPAAVENAETVITDIFSEEWFWPAVAVIIGLPITLLVLGEIQTGMQRRGTPGVAIITLARNVLAPLAAVIILFTQIPQAEVDGFTWAKVAATAFGLVIVVILLNGLNLALFVTARQGTWRNRLPSIFVDIARLLIIVVSLAVLFGWIWNADVGGLFTALGIGSIVIGLALQNAVGSVLSGLFLLFEQPFEIGDWIMTDQGKGRVIAMNWRATHLDTSNGILVIPNSELAGASFRNLTRATSPYEAADVFRFATDDPPQKVIEVMVEVASGLPELHPDEKPYAIPLNKARFEINIPLTSPARQYMTLGLFRIRLWYAARRAGLHLDRDLTDNYATPERARANLLRLAPRFQISREEAEAMLDQVRIERYGEGELLQRDGQMPDGVRVIIEGVAELQVPASQGGSVPVVQLKRDDLLGLTALTRQTVGASATALTDVAVLYIPVTIVDTLVKTRPGLARDIGAAIDYRQDLGDKALSAIGEQRPSEALVIA